MDTNQLRADLAAYFQEPAPAKVVPPTYTGSEKNIDAINQMYFDHIMRKKAGDITPEEREYLGKAIREWELSGRP